jgi:hypothetical protein
MNEFLLWMALIAIWAPAQVAAIAALLDDPSLTAEIMVRLRNRR